MKKIIFAIFLITSNCYAMDPSTFVLLQVTVPSMITEMSRDDKFDQFSAVTVRAVGKGNTCDAALENAKSIAIEKAVGVWMYGEKVLNNEVYKEKVVEYSGGLIKSYNVIRNECTTIEIEAEVVPRTNKISTNSSSVSNETRDLLKSRLENEKRRIKSIQEVNNRSKAIAFDIKEIELQPSKIIIIGQMSFQEKWKHDYNDLRKQTGNFVLDSFYKPIMINVKGYNFGKEIFNTKYQLNYTGFELYKITNSGNVIIYPNKTDTIKLTFPVDSSRIINVDKFEVNIL